MRALVKSRAEPGIWAEDVPKPTIGPNDLLIAATARANGCTLVTHNVREFSRVSGLLYEDWES